MIAIGTSRGVVLAFGSSREARGVAEQIIGMAEWAERERAGKPLLYMTRDSAIPRDEALALLDEMKRIPVSVVTGNMPTTEATPVEHGVSCAKALHEGVGYLHGADDDGPYTVDGVDYCGRCHGVL